MAMVAQKILLLMSVLKISVRHSYGAGVRVAETFPSAEMKCQAEHNDAIYGDCEGRQ
jgi:hypothetical protein